MSATAPIGIKLVLNSKEIGELKNVNLNVGFGGTLAYRPQGKGVPHSLTFKIPTELLKRDGENTLEVVADCKKVRLGSLTTIWNFRILLKPLI